MQKISQKISSGRNRKFGEETQHTTKKNQVDKDNVKMLAILFKNENSSGGACDYR
jgi:macrodomain Ter protein organizer (MatP/YcbG family)